MKLKTLLILSIVIILESCSPKVIVKEDEVVQEISEPVKLEEIFTQEVRLDVKQLHAWVNLMPGSESRFHLSGELDIKNNFKYDMEFMILKKIEVFQNSNSIYIVKPTIQIDETLSSENINKYIRFSTLRGILLDGMLNIDTSINLSLIFYDGKSEYVYKIENLIINRTN